MKTGKTKNSVSFSDSFVLCTLLFVFLSAVLLLMKMPSSSHKNAVSYYFTLDYSMGFSARMLPGTILKLIFPHTLTDKNIYTSSLVVTCAVCVLCSVIFGKLVSSAEKKLKIPCILISLLAFLHPYGLGFFFTRNNLGRLEVYCLFFTLLCVIFLTNKYLRWLIPLLCFAAMATYEAFMFTFMPLIGVLLLYKAVKSKFRGSDTVLCIVTYIVIIASFIYFQFFTKTGSLKYDSVFELMSAASERYEGEIDADGRNALYVQYFMGSASSYTHEALYPMVGDIVRRYLPVIIFISLPAFILINSFFICSFKNTSEPLMKFFFAVCMILPLAAVPMFVFAADYSRWIACAVTVSALCVPCLSAYDTVFIENYLEDYCNNLRKNPLPVFICLALSYALCFTDSADSFISAISEQNYNSWLAWLDNLFV